MVNSECEFIYISSVLVTIKVMKSTGNIFFSFVLIKVFLNLISRFFSTILLRPSECRLKFPITKRPIHKCEVPKHEFTLVPQLGGWRTLLVPKTTPNYYPAVMKKNEYERLKKQAKVCINLFLL